MSSNRRLLDVFEGKNSLKIVLGVSVFIFLVLELLIFMAAASSSGEKSRVTVVNKQGQVVYETSGSVLTAYEKLSFEKNHGPLENYDIQLKRSSIPFPFREWLSAAIGIPVGLTLLMAFLIKVYLSLLYGETKPDGVSPGSSDEKKHRFGSFFQSMSSFSVFHIGAVVIVFVLLLWLVPNFLGNFAAFSMEAIREHKWFFLGVAVFAAFIITWVIYLRYKLSKQMLENQFNLEKFRYETQLLAEREAAPQLTEKTDHVQEP